MKKTLLFICLLFLVKLGIGQTYEPIVDTTKMWVVYLTPAPIVDTTIGRTYAYKISDSILMNDQLYWYKVWESSNSTYTSWNLNGYIREFNKTVVYQDNEMQRIDTLYNFNDTVGSLLGDCNIKIECIDSLEMAGKKRLSQIIDGHHVIEEIHYEGVGSNAGILAPYYQCSDGAYFYLVCYYEKGELKYMNPSFTNCYITGVNEKVGEFINAFPNPTNGKINIDFNNCKIQTPVAVSIFDVIGEKRMSFEIDQNIKTYDLSHLVKGVYFYTVTSKNRTIKTGKLILN